MSDKQHCFWPVVCLSLAVLSSFFIRCFSFENFINPHGGFYFYSIDAYDHLRRITLGIESFPNIVSYDSYAAFPVGLGQLWAPLFDYILAGLLSVVDPSREEVETFCFFLNPLIACFAILLMFFVARWSFASTCAGLASAFLLALHPGYISYSVPMNFDHHVIEPVIVLLLFGLPFIEKQGRLLFWGKLTVALVIVLVIFLWRGSVLFWGFAFFSILWRCVVSRNRSMAQSYSHTFVLAAVALAIYCLADPWNLAHQVSFEVISWFHVIVLGSMAIVLGLYWKSRTNKEFYLLLGGVSLLAVLSLLLSPLYHLVEELAGGLTFISGIGDPWLEINSELNSVFSEKQSFLFSASYLTVFWFLLPGAFLLAYGRWRHTDNMLLINFLAWCPIFVMGLVIRYSHVAAVLVCLAGGLFIKILWEKCGRQWQKIVVAGIFALLLMPGLPHFQNTLAARLPDSMRYGLYGSDGVLDWLKNNTPVTSGYLHSDSLPEYGVLARWSLGARIYQLAERPAMSTAFGWETHGFYQEAGFWVAKDPVKAKGLIDNNTIRYIVVTAVHDLNSDFQVAGQGEREGILAKGTAGNNLSPGLTMYNRLLNGDGGAMLYNGKMLTALQNYRLLFETKYLAQATGNKNGGESYYKVFEVVPGALLHGQVEPGVPVAVSLILRTSRARKMHYFDRTFADKNGKFYLRLPYATTEKQGGTIPQDRYKLKVGGRGLIKFAVTAEEVEKGKSLSIIALQN